jgi:spore coat polysaccharide biosynthesis protein SpsF
MGSTRLPGKVMMKIDEKNPLLYYVLDQLTYCTNLTKFVIATTVKKEDDEIVNFAQEHHISYFRGNSEDVLDRYYQCSKKFLFSTIVRITADNPLIDPQIVDQVIEKFKVGKYDYVTNCLVRTFPYGTEVEIFSFDALELAWKNAKKPSEREHVTPYFFNNKEKFRIFNVTNLENLSHLRWTVDQKEDLDLVRIITSKIKKRPILIKDIIELLSKESNLININKKLIPNEGYLKSLEKEDVS